jgi:hypothetical protein
MVSYYINYAFHYILYKYITSFYYIMALWLCRFKLYLHRTLCVNRRKMAELINICPINDACLVTIRG